MKRSAGLLIYRRTAGEIEVLLVHPGGPFWAKRDAGAWQIPKGGIEDGEAPGAAAVREAREELGLEVTAALQPLGEIRQAGGKYVVAFAAEQDFNPDELVSVDFEMEWPPRSRRFQTFPEVDAARWMSVEEARAMILASQEPLLDRLLGLFG